MSESEAQPILNNESSVSSPEMPQLDRALQVVTPNPKFQEEIMQNILTIREVVQDGRHETLYYPGSGVDILRALFAYEAGHLIAIDEQSSVFQVFEGQLRSLGVAAEVTESDGRRDLVFQLGGRRRVVTEFIGDARSVSPRDFGYKRVDVLHIYAPQEAIEDALTVKNYDMVAEGGFFVIDEGKIGSVQALHRIIGLKQKRVAPRTNVATTIGVEDPESLSQRIKERRGYIYQKVSTVDNRLIQLLAKAEQLDDEFIGPISAFRNADLESLVEAEGGDIRQEVLRKYGELKTRTVQMAGEFLQAGAQEDLVEQYKAEELQRFQDEILEAQSHFKDFLSAHQEAMAKFDAGEISEDDFLVVMGIEPVTDTRGNIYRYRATKWPAAKILLAEESESDQFNADLYWEAIVDFAEAKFEVF